MVCGTDTLGVGVNVPIRTVMLTGLCKYDGRGSRILSAREFRQICGRAGRRGFDTIGYVVAQAPEHVIENLKLAAKAAANKKKYLRQTQAAGTRLRPLGRGQPSPAPDRAARAARFQFRRGPPHAAQHPLPHARGRLRRAEETSSTTATSRRPRRRRSANAPSSCSAACIGARILHIIPPADGRGPNKVVVDVALPEDFSINHALSLWLLDAIAAARPGSRRTMRSTSFPSSRRSSKNPDIILRKQVDLLKSELMARLKDEGMEYRGPHRTVRGGRAPRARPRIHLHRLQRLHAPPPLPARAKTSNPRPSRERCWRTIQSFEDYIKTYKLERAEAVLLRHLNEVYKVLSQTIPDAAKTEHLHEAESFLELIVRHTDSSMLDEWQAMKNPGAPIVDKSSNQQSAIINLQSKIPYTKNKAAFARHLRNHILTLVTALSRYDTEAALSLIAHHDSDGKLWSNERLLQQLNTYHAARHQIRLDPEARNARHTHISEDGLTIHQTLIDPDDFNDWAIHLTLDLEKSNEARTPVLHLESIAAL